MRLGMLVGLCSAMLSVTALSQNSINPEELAAQAGSFDETKGQFTAPEGHNNTATCSSAWMIAGQLEILFPGSFSSASPDLDESGAHGNWRHWLATEIETAGGRPSPEFWGQAAIEENRLRNVLATDGPAFFRSLGHCWVYPSARKLDDIGLILRNYLVQQNRLPPEKAVANNTRQARISQLLEDKDQPGSLVIESADEKLIALCESYSGVPLAPPRDAAEPKRPPIGPPIPQRELLCEIY